MPCILVNFMPMLGSYCTRDASQENRRGFAKAAQLGDLRPDRKMIARVAREAVVFGPGVADAIRIDAVGENVVDALSGEPGGEGRGRAGVAAAGGVEGVGVTGVQELLHDAA